MVILYIFQKDQFLNSCRLALGNSNEKDSVTLLENLEIFLHEPGKFIFFREQDQLSNNYRINMNNLK